jgi:hypothetical protein
MKYLRGFPWIGLFPLILAIVTGNWLAEAIQPFLTRIPFLRDNLLASIIFLVLLVSSIIWIYHHRKSFLGIRSLQQVKTRSLEGLILLLSTPNHVPERFSFPITIKDRNGNEATLKGQSLNHDIEELNKVKWNWQQILRGLKPHQERLKYLYLLGSTESFKYLDKAESFIKQYLPDITVIKANRPVNFEDLEALIKVIYRAIKDLKAYKLDEDEIIIDITGGQKVTSIAGAVVTLNSSVRFQYVQTNEPYEVISYDLTIQGEASI